MTEQNEKEESKSTPVLIDIKQRRNGLNFYVYDTTTGILEVAKTEILPNGKMRVSIDMRNRYLWALNIENAKRKLRKYGYSL